MPASIDQKLDKIRSNPALLRAISSLQRGIEKESLRVTPEGKLALTPHSAQIGSALTHPNITTDYSEALLEFITPVQSTISGTLDTLEDIHTFTYQKIAAQKEMLWTNSMPCQLVKANDIPVAQYGSSNVATMKTIYRIGLGHRYGRPMQTIAGIHYNFSLTDKFWMHYQKLLDNTASTKKFKTQQYFGLIRNFRRFVPLYVYLFGASPAICRSFLQGNAEHQLTPFDDHSWHGEYATSLRMGDLGYQSSAQENLFVCYNNLNDYIESLRKAITIPHPDYEAIGLKDEQGNYKQLNTALLQIENEFYSTIRPKRVAASGEAPINALARGGVEYIEVRCIDINPFLPMGIDIPTIRFLDMFLLYCLFEDSPKLKDCECKQTTVNLKTIVNRGREPGVSIKLEGKEILFKDWASTLLDKMTPIAKLLDGLHAGDSYQNIINEQRQKLEDPSLTPSSQVLATMKQEGITFAEFSRRQSSQWQSHFLDKNLSERKMKTFEQIAADSLIQQAAIEAADNQPFDDYLANFYQQYFKE